MRPTMYMIRQVDLDTGESEVVMKGLDRQKAEETIEKMRTLRRSAPRKDGMWPMPVHHIVRSH